MKLLATTLGAVALCAIGVSGGAAQTGSTPTNMTGHHTMDGEVTKVDAKKGWVDVKTAEGSMKLHFPPAALENVKKGDSITVELGMIADQTRKK
jgi:hypothetical protein